VSWSGEVEVLSVAGEYPPYIVSARVKAEGSEWSLRYFTVDEPIVFPITEKELVERWIVPML
jgi:hypothetical protein